MKLKLFALAACLLTATGLHAQDTTRVPTGVELVGRYSVSKRPLVAVRPVAGATAAVTQAVTEILQKDLQYSDRFEMGAVPAQLASGPVDYRAWNSLNVWYLVAAALTPAGQGFQLRVDLHDVVYARIKSTITQPIPAPGAGDFRMAVHAVSDEIVRAITGQPGIAATRVVFVRKSGNGYALALIDSDGAGEQQLFSSADAIYSPAWSPDGSRVAYGLRLPSAKIRLDERDVATGRVRSISSRPEINYAPAYSPDGKKLAFTVSVGSVLTEIDEYDLAQNCCLKRLSRGPRNDLNPSYSPDGSMIAFNSDRLGQPHIYIMPSGGGEALLISPFNQGEPGYYTAPDWSPVSDEIVFAGRSRGEHQIMIARASRPGIAQQITSSGRNEDPSWAPDGRHIVFTGVGSGGSGLYVIDTQTGNTRKLASGSKLQMADWSPVLMRSAGATGNGN